MKIPILNNKQESEPRKFGLTGLKINKRLRLQPVDVHASEFKGRKGETVSGFWHTFLDANNEVLNVFSKQAWFTREDVPILDTSKGYDADKSFWVSFVSDGYGSRLKWKIVGIAE